MNRKPITVLITSAGGAAGQNCIDALRKQNELIFRLIAVDANPLSAGLYKSDKSFIVPQIDSEHYLDVLLSICKQEAVDVIIPTYSKEINLFSSNKTMFEEITVKMCISNENTVSTFESKWLAYNFFQTHSIPTVPTWRATDLPERQEFPLYLKPDKGSGTRNHFKIETPDELVIQLKKLTEDYIAQIFIKGRELTIDVIADQHSRVLCAIARERLRVQNGMAVVAKTIPVDPYISYVQKVVAESQLVGPSNIQGFILDNDLLLTDVNTRFAAGGLPLSVAAGANLPLINIKLAMGMDVSPIKEYKIGLVMLRYYNELFVREEGSNFVLHTPY
jgi:carbamoyl-phosphate synthase large subunit